MDLYEALKAGTSSEELENAFRKELADAQKRVEQEKKQQDEEKEYLSDCRDALADAIIDYIDAFSWPDNLFDVTTTHKSIRDALLGFEKELDSIVAKSEKIDKLIKEVEKADPNTPIVIKKTYSTKDKDVIDKFIKSLK